MSTHEHEWQTRKARIDTRLEGLSSPWKIVRHKDGMRTTELHACAVEEYPTEKGPADYALFVQGKLLGIIEAKKVGVGPQNVLEQAKRYAYGANEGAGNWNGYRVPFLYATNGEVVHFIDVRSDKNRSRQLSSFHTPEALVEMFDRPQQGQVFEVHDPPAIYGLRPYQLSAIEATETAIRNGKRALLVAMATGTGKTFVTVSQIYRLLHTGAAKRILFLVDRRALAAQAVREFSSFNTPSGLKFNQEYEVYSQRFKQGDFGEDDPFDPKLLPEAYLTTPQPSHTFVYVSTIQRMAINLFGFQNAFEQSSSDPDYEEEADTIPIPIHAFDVIIADECHRGYTAKETAVWRSVMDHFDAIKIGLTATPAPHTLSLFKEVVFRYTTEEAIEDGYLVDYDAVKISSGVLMKGAFLKEGEHVGSVDTDTGVVSYDELEDEREFASTEIEHSITVPETNRKIILELAQYAYEHEAQTGRFPKILIFASNDLQHVSHADQLVSICKEVFNQGDDFVKKITGNANVDRPLQRIREFRNRPNPKIVVSVDMLTTGVDIPSLEFIVFLRPVKSRILWVQMLGRGTRLCKDINKDHFTIFDCFNGTLIEYFRNTTDFHIEAPEKETIPIAKVIENIYQNVDREYNTNVLVKRLRRIEKNMSGKAREAFSAYIPDGDMGKFAGALRQSLKDDFTDVMKILRDKEFQRLLVDYDRAKRTFTIAIEQQDEVSSEYLFRTNDGEVKAEDYLDSFNRFVRENPEQIEAISILLNRPKEWKTDVLDDLRRKLQRNRYGEEELRKAHKLVYNKALADIISMVKHSAKDEEPILTAEERVDNALLRVMSGKTFTDEQQLWIGYIRDHLVRCLTLDVEDFDLQPVFGDRGGLRIAKKVFPELELLIEEINYAIAA